MHYSKYLIPLFAAADIAIAQGVGASYYAAKCTPLGSIINQMKSHKVDATSICINHYTTARTVQGSKTYAVPVTVPTTVAKTALSTLSTTSMVVKTRVIQTATSYYATISAGAGAKRLRKRLNTAAEAPWLTRFKSASIKEACDCFLVPVTVSKYTTVTKYSNVYNIVGTRTITKALLTKTAEIYSTKTISKNQCSIVATQTAAGVPARKYFTFKGRRGDLTNEIGTALMDGNGANSCWSLCNEEPGCIAVAQTNDRMCHFYSAIQACGTTDALFYNLGILQGAETYPPAPQN